MTSTALSDEVRPVCRLSPKLVVTADAEKPDAVWQEENREALISSNAYVERYGLPLAGFRR